MAAKTAIAILNGFFNVGDGVSLASEGGDTVPATTAGVPVKRGVSAFRDELKALSDEEKSTLAAEVCAVTGDTLVTKK